MSALSFRPACLAMALLAADLFAAGGALAQGAGNYPSRAVTIIVPIAPGAATENEGRLWLSKISESLGQQFVMDFRPGATTTLGLGYASRQKPDGYTLAFVTSTYSLLPLMFKELPFDHARGFEHVSLLSKRGALLAVSNNLPVHTIREYIAHARAHPGEINFATSGPGGIHHLMGLWLTSATETKVTFVHYKAAGAAYPDLIAGRVQMMPLTFSGGYAAMVKPGKVRAIAIANVQRSALLPDLTTASEQGVPDYEYPSWLGLLAPARTPVSIIDRLQAEFAKISKQPDLQQKAGEDTTLIASTPEQFRRLLVDETARWRKLVVDNNIRIEESN